MSDQSQTTDPRIIKALEHNAALGGSRMIDYEGMIIMAPLRDIQEAIVALNEGDRQQMMRSVNAAIRRTFPKVKRGTASQKAAMECGQDIAIWFANEVIEGRASLGVQ